jgi:hypothetical protein
MIFNLYILLISWNLVWIWVHIARFIRVFFIFFLFFIFYFLSVLFKTFWVFVFISLSLSLSLSHTHTHTHTHTYIYNIFSCIWLKILKLFKYLKKTKILWHFFKEKILHALYNKFVNSQRIWPTFQKYQNYIFVSFNIQDYELIRKTYS